MKVLGVVATSLGALNALQLTVVAGFSTSSLNVGLSQRRRAVKRAVPFSVSNDICDIGLASNDNTGDSCEDEDLSLTMANRREFLKKMALSVAAVSIIQSTNVADASALDAEDEENKDGEMKEKPESFDPRYFLAGGGCAAFSHGIATPFDVVKTKMQADPDTFNSGFSDSITSLVKNDGPGVLLSGLVPTLIGFGVEGAVKFGVYESLKPFFMSLLHTDEKFIPYLAASIGAGAVACLMLCPMERTRIKMVTSDEKTGPLGGIGALIQEEGVSSLYFGYTTMLMKQIPYTMMKQVSFEIFATQFTLLAASLSMASNEETRLLTTVASAFLASILACTISQPGDVLITRTFKENGTDAPIENSKMIYDAQGLKGFFTGYSARLAHVASIVTSQLVVYDFLKQLLGLPATGM